MPVGDGVVEAAAEEVATDFDCADLAEVESDFTVVAAAALNVVEAGEADNEAELVVSIVQELHCQ